MNTNLYNLAALIARHIRKKFKEIYCLLTNKKFYCASLQGKSIHGITVNSDLTVSCNCSDIYGHGKIGDLKSENFEDIFKNKTVKSLRKNLQKGKLPIMDCVTCRNLFPIKKSTKTPAYILPRFLLIENTVACNLNCIACNRKKVMANRKKLSMSLDDIKYLSQKLKTVNPRSIHYYNQGEPFISKNIKKEITILKKDHPQTEITTSTNSLLINSDEKRQAAMLFDHIYFSIDGATQASVEKYQKGSDFKKAYKNMTDLVKFRGKKNKPVIEWKYVLFRWNDRHQQLKKAAHLAKKSGVDLISFIKTLNPIYGFSYRFFLNYKYFNNFGYLSSVGRHLIFNKNFPRVSHGEDL